MDLKLEFYGSLCSTEIFEINKIEADEDDFGYGEDIGKGAEQSCCSNRQFKVAPFSDDVLKKYKISAQDYFVIAQQLKAGLSFGSCSWCE